MPHAPHIARPHPLRPLAHCGGQVPDLALWFTQAPADAPERRWLRVQGAEIETLAWGRVGDPGLRLLHGNAAHAGARRTWQRRPAPKDPPRRTP